jgi:hypothetical protein
MGIYGYGPTLFLGGGCYALWGVDRLVAPEAEGNEHLRDRILHLSSGGDIDLVTERIASSHLVRLFNRTRGAAELLP